MTRVDTKIEGLIHSFLKEHLSRYGLEQIDVEVGRDHSGDPALFINAYYRLSKEPVQPRSILHVLTELRHILVSQGETRFPYLRHHFDEKQQVATRG